MKLCIIGNGLTSLVLAKNLIKRNILVDISASSNKSKIFKNRTIGISEYNIRVLEKIFPSISNLGNPINKINIYNEKNKKEIINFQNESRQQFSVFEYNRLYDFVKKSLTKDKKNLKFLKNKKIVIEKIRDKYDLIIDTELRDSFSKKYFYNKLKKNYYSNSYVSIINHKKINNNTAEQYFTKIGPLAFLPINYEKTSLVFSIIEKNKKLLTNKKLISYIKSYNNKYNIKSFENFESFKINMVLLKKYYYKNVLVFGDKLHSIHPLAGQGFNMNLRDIEVLINILDKKIKLGLPIDESVSVEFEKSSKFKNIIFSSSIDFIHEFFLFEKKLPKNISNTIFYFFKKQKFLNKLSQEISNKGFN